MKKASKLIIPNGDGIMCLKELAVLFGDREAMVIQQVYYLTYHTELGKYHDGRRWVSNTYAQWAQHCFPFWKERFVRFIFTNLVKNDVLECKQLHGAYSRINSYCVKPEIVQILREKAA